MWCCELLRCLFLSSILIVKRERGREREREKEREKEKEIERVSEKAREIDTER